MDYGDDFFFEISEEYDRRKNDAAVVDAEQTLADREIVWTTKTHLHDAGLHGPIVDALLERRREE